MYGSEDKKEKTLVFVSNVPNALKGVKMLKALVKRSVPGGLLDGRIIDGSGYALLLFDCTHTAVAACRASITWDVKIDGPALEAEAEKINQQLKSKNMNYADLVKLQQEIGKEVVNGSNGKSVIRYTFKLRVVQQEHKIVVEETYKPTILIQGSEVAKADLAMSLGLMGAYRGDKAPKWCVHTQKRCDCRLGSSCNFIHLKAYQTTLKRSREFTADGSVLSGDAIGGAEGGGSGGAPRRLHELWDERVAPLFGGCGSTPTCTAPPLAPLLGRVALTSSDINSLVGSDGIIERLERWLASSATDCSSSSAARISGAFYDDGSFATVRGLAKQLMAVMKGAPNVVPFLRLDTPYDGSTSLSYYACPVDLGASPVSAGMSDLRHTGNCTMPSNDAPTPMERDGVVRELLLKRGVVSSINNSYSHPRGIDDPSGVQAFGALCVFLLSPGVAANLLAHTNEGTPTSVLVFPHYVLGHVVQECRLFVKNSKVVCVAQKTDSVLVEGGWLETSLAQTDSTSHLLRSMPSAVRPTDFATFLSEAIDKAAKGVEAWLQTTQSRDVTCCVNIAFPRGTYSTGPNLPVDVNNLALERSSIQTTTDSHGSNSVGSFIPLVAVPTPNLIRPTPGSLHMSALIQEHSPLVSPPTDYLSAFSHPIILGVDSFDAAVGASTLYSLSGGARAESSVPGMAAAVQTLWRKNRTSNQPLFSREQVLTYFKK